MKCHGGWKHRLYCRQLAAVTNVAERLAVVQWGAVSTERCLVVVEGTVDRKRKANWIGHILCTNCLLHVIEGKIKGQIEVTWRRGRRRKELLDDLKYRRGYCQLKEEALDRTMWRNRFGRGFGPVVWQITDDDDDYCRQQPYSKHCDTYLQYICITAYSSENMPVQRTHASTSEALERLTPFLCPLPSQWPRAFVTAPLMLYSRSWCLLTITEGADRFHSYSVWYLLQEDRH